MSIGAKTLAAAGLCASGMLFAQTSSHRAGITRPTWSMAKCKWWTRKRAISRCAMMRSEMCKCRR